VQQTHSTLSDGRLFFEGITPIGGRGGMSVVNLQTRQTEFQRTPDQTTALHISRVNFELDHLYLVTAGDTETYSVFALPKADTPIATTWTSRPYGRLTGWTQVCKNEIRQRKCDSVLVKDDNGGYPGPWS
jgi:hypothetical protein